MPSFSDVFAAVLSAILPPICVLLAAKHVRLQPQPIVENLPKETRKEKKPRLRLYCELCGRDRDAYHTQHEPSGASKQRFLNAWYGDALLALDACLYIGERDGLKRSALTSNETLADYIRTRFPALVPPLNPAGQNPSAATLGTIFEEQYWLSSDFRKQYWLSQPAHATDPLGFLPIVSPRNLTHPAWPHTHTLITRSAPTAAPNLPASIAPKPRSAASADLHWTFKQANDVGRSRKAAQ